MEKAGGGRERRGVQNNLFSINTYIRKMAYSKHMAMTKTFDLLNVNYRPEKFGLQFTIFTAMAVKDILKTEIPGNILVCSITNLQFCFVLQKFESQVPSPESRVPHICNTAS